MVEEDSPDFTSFYTTTAVSERSLSFMGTAIGRDFGREDLEDRANGATHAMGAGGAMAGLGLLAVLGANTGDPWKIVSLCLYGATLVLLFTASTLYHSSRTPSHRRAWRALDHASIPLLIAGTYTPFLLVNLRGPWGWSLLGAIWSLALASIALGLWSHGRHKATRTILFLVMGWLIVVALPPLFRTLTVPSLVLLVSGGVAYSVGSAFYLLDRRIRFGHAVWHLFVVAAGVCHFLSIVLGVVPFGG